MNQKDFTSERTSLAKVQQEFEAWRNTRTKRTTIPEYLWQAAVDLSPHYSLTKISRTLSVDYRLLKERVHGSGCSGTHPGEEAGGYTFVELGMGEMESNRECVVELQDAEGSWMRVQVKGKVDVVQLLKSFWYKGR